MGVIACAAAVSFAPAPLGARDAAFDPLAAYGPEIVFDVWRADKRIGTHRVTFTKNGGAIIADSRFDIRITVLGLPVYRYGYRSEGTWHDGQLQRLHARTDDDGNTNTVDAERRGDLMTVKGGDVQSVAPAGIFPTTHWNPGVIGARQVLNTITGHVNTVGMTLRGTGPVATADGPRMARHYTYTGELETEVWYDMDGRWVKMRFNGRDGTPIEYVCRRCGTDDRHSSEGRIQGMAETL